MADNFRLASGSLSLDGDSGCLPLIDTLASGIVAATQQIIVHAEKCNHLAHKTHLLVTALHDYVSNKLEEDIADANSELKQSIDKVIAVFERVHKRLREYTEYSRVETLLKVSEVENGLNTCESDLDTNGFFPSPPFDLFISGQILPKPYLFPCGVLDYCHVQGLSFFPYPGVDLVKRDLPALRCAPFRQPSDFLTETVSYLTFSSHHWRLLQSISLIVHSPISVSDKLEQQQLFLTRNRDWTLLSWCPWAGTTRDVPL